MSQLFFDNSTFHRFREMADIAGIDVPIEAGIMPVTNKKQIERMVSMCGASLPPKFVKAMQKYESKMNEAYVLLDDISYVAEEIDAELGLEIAR